MKLKIESITPNMVVQHCDGNELWASSNYAVLKYQNNPEHLDGIFELPVRFDRRFIGKFRLPSRVLRLGIRSLKKLSNGTLLINANKRIYRVSNDGIESVLNFKHGVGPLRYGCCEDPAGLCYIGEYFVNNQRSKPIRLFRSDDNGKNWQIAHNFWNIKHIHCIQSDPYSSCIWMSTGDSDDESIIALSDDCGESWDTVGSGDQMYRAVSFLFTRDHVYWGSDAPTRQNYIYRFVRKTCQIERLAAVNSPVHYSTIVGNNILLFGTTVEGNSEGKSAEWDNKVRIWGSRDGVHWEPLIFWQKDVFWPYDYFGYGRVLFPSGNNDTGWVFFTTQAVKNFDNMLIQAKILDDRTDVG